MRRAHSISFQSFPKQRIRLVRIRNLHAVDFHKYKVIQFVSHDGCVQLGNDFSDCCCLSSSGSARYIDTCSGAFVDGCLKVRIY